METRQFCGELYWFESSHPNGENQRYIFEEANKNREQNHGPAIIINVRDSYVSNMRLIRNLDYAISKSIAYLNGENRYFFRLVNTLKPLSYHCILESKLTLRNHI
jgi:hypothetical protein